uniref:Cas system-associated protein n=1 Tax=Siphoviridae sp. ctX5W26 TaxID=2825540 RepID=A0A8S5UER6_9CAUD|nr:MAG TPA: Cas system-associated protein [Siphoviridae sp. ctX5W26]
MRLVDADELIKKFRQAEINTENENNMFSIARRMIEEEPTVFDVDKVVERIEDIKRNEDGACSEQECRYCKYSRECWCGGMGDFLALYKAIEIIKCGIANDKM